MNREKAEIFLLIFFIALSTFIYINSVNLQEKALPLSNKIINNELYDSINQTKPTKISNIQPLVESPFSLHTIVFSNASNSETGFISKWNTTMISSSSSNSTQISLPLESNGIYNFNVSWGDGTSNIITKYNQPEIKHTYFTSGTYTLNITGIISGWRFNNIGDVLKLIQISSWGPLRLGNDGYYFYGALNLVLTTQDVLDLNGTTNLEGAFENCYSLGSTGNLNSWNVSKVTNMAKMFFDTGIFYQPYNTFYYSSLNQSLITWNVSHVTDMSNMFAGASSFNQPLNSWNVSQVTDLSGMLSSASSFNQPLGSWDVSHVTDMSYMFEFVTLSISNYDQLLIKWVLLPQLTHNIRFDAGFSKYNLSAEKAHEILSNTFGWKITDGGLINTSTITLENISTIISQVNISNSFLNFSNLNVLIGLIAFVGSSGLVSFLSIASVNYNKLKKYKNLKGLKFSTYLTNKIKFRKDKPQHQNKLAKETLDKIEEIINENKE